MLSEARGSYELALQAAQEQSSPPYVRVLLNRVILDLMHGRSQEAVVDLAKVIETDKMIGYLVHSAKAEVLLGSLMLPAQEKEAFEHMSRGLEIVRDLGYRKGEVDLLVMIARQVFHKGDYDEAARMAGEALFIANEIDYTNGKIRAWGVRALLHSMQGENDDALEITQAIRNESVISENVVEEMNAQRFSASIYAAQGRHAEAKETLEKALSVSRRIEYRSGEAEIMSALAVVYEQVGELERAAEVIAASQAIFQYMGVIANQENGGDGVR